MANIRPSSLPEELSPSASDVTIIDGLTTRKTTLDKLVAAGRPLASQAEAEAGVEATKAMTALTTAQAIDARGGAQFATAAQGALADTAVQPADLATVATTGAYGDLSGKPTLGTAAATDATDYATAAQKVPAGGTTGQVLAKASVADNDVAWTAAGVGDMLAVTYDPQAIGADTFDRANHTGVQAFETVESASRAPGFLYGLTLSNNATDADNDIDILSGACRSIENDIDIVLAASITKRLDATWAVGTNAGGLDTGAKANSAGYHVWLIRRSDTGVVDVLFSTSATNPAMPAGYDQKRRIGAILTDASGVIRPFVQNGGWFMLKAPIGLTASWGNIGGNSPALKSSLAPTGVKMRVRIGITTTSTSAGYVAVTDPDLGAPTVNTHAAYYQPASVLTGAIVEVSTDTSARVYAVHGGANTVTSNTFLHGWYDIRDTSV